MIFYSLLFLVASYLLLPTEHVNYSKEKLPEESIILKGKIDSQVYLKDSSLSFILKSATNHVNIRYFYEQDIKEIEKPLENIETGRECIVKGVKTSPQVKSNPGQFDYMQYLANQNIQAELLVNNLEDISCGKKSLFTPIWSLRNKIILKLQNNYSETTSSWIIALVLGEDSFIDPNIIDLFRHWNISHLLAISGLHTAIFVGIIYFILIKLLRLTLEKTQIILYFIYSNIIYLFRNWNFRRVLFRSGLHTAIFVGIIYFILIKLLRLTLEKTQIILIIILPIFIILSGAEPSVIRASLMIISFIILSFFKVKLTSSDIVSWLFIILIIINPSLLNHIGFQFSFAVTFSLLISLKWLNQTNNRISQSFKISFISQMIILPLQLHYFSVFQPLSIFLNVIVIPYFTIIVIPLIFIMILFMLFPTILRELLDDIFVGMHTMFVDTLLKLDILFSEYFVIGDLSVVHFLIYYLILFMFMWAIEKNKIKYSVILGTIFVIFILFLNNKEVFSPEGRVTMLDIGQGDAIVIELPYREGVFMMDIGSSFSFTDMKPSSKVYKQVIKPYLYHRGIDSVDGIFLSHDHLDHTGSLEFMLNEFRVGELFISPYHPIEGDLLNALETNQTKITIINPTEKITRNQLLFQILHPEKDQFDENDNSLIVYTKIGGKSWLFNGDASTHNELALLQKFPNLKADILKVGHHGSDTSTDELF